MSAAELTKETIVGFLHDIFTRRGGEEYLGEPVTMAEHMLQGAYFAETEGEDEIIIVATLLHDVGHFTSEFGMFSMDDTVDKYHEDAGADILAQFFPPVVTECVKQHVAAKRYLCATDAAYFGKLSDASVHSLNLQGGPMSEIEVEAFQKHPHLAEVVKVRLFDDRGKEAGLKTPDFAYYAPMVQRVVDGYCVA